MRRPSDRIAIIAVDDPSNAGSGRWPWSGNVRVHLIDQLSAVKAIAHVAFFSEPQTNRGLRNVWKMKNLPRLLLLPAGSGVHDNLNEPSTKNDH